MEALIKIKSNIASAERQVKTLHTLRKKEEHPACCQAACCRLRDVAAAVALLRAKAAAVIAKPALQAAPAVKVRSSD
jgi:hypothetical protein